MNSSGRRAVSRSAERGLARLHADGAPDEQAPGMGARTPAPPSPVTVLVPVLGRPQRVRPLIASLASTAIVTPIDLLFLVSPEDEVEQSSLTLAHADPRIQADRFRWAWEVMAWTAGHGDYARKINYGFRVTSTPYVFTGADDLAFRPGWIERAVALQLETGVCVIGTNDAGNERTIRGGDSTHSLVHRDYLECGTIDTPGLLMHEGYEHNFVDSEMVGTARARGTYQHAADVIVEHLHPLWGKAAPDATYSKGAEGFQRDSRLHAERSELWDPR